MPSIVKVPALIVVVPVYVFVAVNTKVPLPVLVNPTSPYKIEAIVVVKPVSTK